MIEGNSWVYQNKLLELIETNKYKVIKMKIFPF